MTDPGATAPRRPDRRIIRRRAPGPRRCGIAMVVFVPAGRIDGGCAYRDAGARRGAGAGCQPVRLKGTGTGANCDVVAPDADPTARNGTGYFVRAPCDMNAASTPNGLIPAMPWRPARA